MTMRWLLRRSVPRCMPGDVRRGDGENIQGMCGMNTTGRIHILASHATLLCLLDFAAPSPLRVVKACNLSYPSIVCSRNLKSLLTLPASQLPTGIASSGQLAPSRQRCGIQRYVYFSGMVLHFVCAEHGCINANQL
jgi:hypothetical protein